MSERVSELVGEREADRKRGQRRGRGKMIETDRDTQKAMLLSLVT